MSLKKAALLALVGTTLLTVRFAVGLISDLSAVLSGAIAAMEAADMPSLFAGEPKCGRLPVRVL